MSAAEVRPFTVDDLAALPEDGLRHEILAGVHIVSPAPRNPHQAVLGVLHGALWSFLEEHPGLGLVQFAPTDVVLSPIDVVAPDLFFIRAERMEIYVPEDDVRGAPDLVVEILSPSTRRRDRGQKLGIYDRFGVSEVWLADPERHTVEIHRRRDGRLHRAALLSELADLLTSPLVPGFALTLDRLFRGIPRARD